MENKKMTKKEMFELIMEESSNELVLDFCEHEIELLEKRANRKGTSMTKTQKENMLIKETIMETVDNEPKSIKEIQELGGSLSKLSVQKMSALLKQLVDSGQIEKVMDKKKAKFKKAGE